MSESSHGQLELFSCGGFFKDFWEPFGSPLGPFEVFFLGHFLFLASSSVILFGGLISRSSEFLGPDFIRVGA